MQGKYVVQSPLRIPAGGAADADASSACRPRAAPLSANQNAKRRIPLYVRPSAPCGVPLTLHSPHPLPSGHRCRLEPYPAGWPFISLGRGRP
ncbi:hypothetical protein [Propionispora sp. 2/2-37]|uniref:hypothetical protein n=1 Tax=Propionispora sp. 2/2-37 TaxID=1677858 RepID=UPI001C10CCD1|nr:hypothetical protein [Propionispora sp. 2/2-37]